MEGPLSGLHILFQSINKHGRHRQILFLIGDLKKYSSLKPLGQMNRNLVGRSIYEDCSFRPDRLAHMATTETW